MGLKTSLSAATGGVTAPPAMKSQLGRSMRSAVQGKVISAGDEPPKNLVKLSDGHYVDRAIIDRVKARDLQQRRATRKKKRAPAAESGVAGTVESGGGVT